MSETTEINEVQGTEPDYQAEAREALQKLAMLEENMADVVLALDNVGWNIVGEELDTNEIPLETIRTKAKTTRALLVLNPIAKRGVSVRGAYIWGGGVAFDGLDEKAKFVKNKTNQKYLLSPQAWAEMEACLATDGNFFLLVNKGAVRKANADKAKVARVPIQQITGTVSDPDNPEDVWFYKREWTTTINNTSQIQDPKPQVAYYPAIDYDETNGRPRNIRNAKVVWDSAIAHQAVNKQVGWRWGVGDLVAVIFWLGAHKKFLEMSAQLVQAYSRFAFKATQPTAAGAKATAAKVAAQPSINPLTGQPNDVGGTAVLSGGANLQAIGRTGGSVDFSAGLPLAGYVAAGLEIPLTELLADASNANRSSAETLNGATNKTMKARQELHKRFFENIFSYLGMEDVSVNFPPIESEQLLRVMQAIQAVHPLNALSIKEVRALVLKAFDMQGSEEPPTEEELGLLLASNLPQQETGDGAAPSAEPSYGDNGLRDDVGQHEYTDGNNG